MSTFFVRDGQHTWCLDGRIYTMNHQLTIEEDKYILHCRTTPKYAREKHYKSVHLYDVEIDAAHVPHDLRVWLVDFSHRVGVFEIDECTKSQAIIFINSHMLRWEDHIRELSEMIERRDPCLIEKRSKYRIQLKVQHEFEDDLSDEISIIKSPNKIKTIEKMPWEKYPEIYAEMMKEVEGVKAELKKLEEADRENESRMIQEKKDREVELMRERENHVKNAVEMLGTEEDMERFLAEYMPETEKRAFLQKCYLVIPDGFEEFLKPARCDFCVCEYCDMLEENYHYFVDDATELTAEEFRAFKILKTGFTVHDNTHVVPEKHTYCCDECEKYMYRICFRVERKFGDYTVWVRMVMSKKK